MPLPFASLPQLLAEEKKNRDRSLQESQAEAEARLKSEVGRVTKAAREELEALGKAHQQVWVGGWVGGTVGMLVWVWVRVW
jgi:hypothetical protein